MLTQKFLTTSELAKYLGVSRIAVFNKIKTGKIKAEKIGRNFAIPVDQPTLTGKLSSSDKEKIDLLVARAVKEYGEDFRLLGSE